MTGGENVVAQPVHLVFTWSSESERAVLYVDAEVVADVELGGVLGATKHAWDLGDHLGLANELSGGRAWRGTYHLVAFYARALTASEVVTKFNSPDRPRGAPATRE